MSRLRVLLADDHDVVRRALRTMLQTQCDVCGEARNGRDAVRQAHALRPDVVLLDLKMPELNGLDAARAIRRDHPWTVIILLTMQPSEELAHAAHAIGIRAVVLKSDVETIEGLLLEIRDETVQVCGAPLRQSRHIAAFFANDGERDALLRPLFAEGRARGERTVHIVREPLQYQDAVEVRDSYDFYLNDGHFDPDATRARMHDLLARGAGDGYRLTRLIAHMEWALDAKGGVDQLPAYEMSLNDTLPSSRDIVICAYDLEKFNGRTIVDVMRAHPTIILGGSLYENAFYRATI